MVEFVHPFGRAASERHPPNWSRAHFVDLPFVIDVDSSNLEQIWEHIFDYLGECRKKNPAFAVLMTTSISPSGIEQASDESDREHAWAGDYCMTSQ